MTISPSEALTRCIEHREIFHDEMLHLMRMLMRGEMSPQIASALLMGLRVREGIDPTRFAARTGLPLQDALDATILAAAVEEGYLFHTPQTLRATPEGRLRLEALLGALVL